MFSKNGGDMLGGTETSLNNLPRAKWRIIWKIKKKRRRKKEKRS
jgi:hypothetical protein